MNSTNEFKIAKKMITTPDLINRFLKGSTVASILQFMSLLQKSVEGKCMTDTKIPNNQCIQNFIEVLKSLEELIKETPPFEQPQRFGNKAYQSWYTKVENNYDTYIQKIIDIQKHPNLDQEIKSYFLDCFGSSRRIDYGTGHELNFLCILLILYKTGYYTEEDFPGLVHHLFYPYIFLVRNLQITYKLEPAGAHGVWGLDEYHFLPFLFGASELIKHPEIMPSDIHRTDIMKEFSDKYMYLNCIKYVKTVKSGNFSEHSPMLDTISQVPNWEKVAKGLVKKYFDEVLKKYVVMQHFYFGSVLPWE